MPEFRIRKEGKKEKMPFLIPGGKRKTRTGRAGLRRKKSRDVTPAICHSEGVSQLIVNG